MQPVAAAGSIHGEPYDHNGGTTTIDTHAGIIVYAGPKPGIRKHVRQQAVLFRGNMSDQDDVRGTAFTFKAGCEPAPYAVRGRFSNGYQSTLTLVGKAPVRSKSGCAVTGYSASSPNARLVFEYEFPPEL